MRRCCRHRQPPICRLYKYMIFIIGGFLILSYLSENTSVFYRSSIVMPFSLHLNKNDIYMSPGEEMRLYVFGLNKRVSYYSTNFRVAGVNFNGMVFSYRTGKAFIIAKVDGKKLKCRVHVIDINRDSLSLKEGESYRLKIAGTSSFISWKSSDPKVATVGMFGRVRARNGGSAVITAKIKKSKLKCTVTVEKIPETGNEIK